MSNSRTSCWWIAFILAGYCLFIDLSAAAPLRLAITDLEGQEQLQREFGSFRKLLSKHCGIEFQFFSVPNRTAAIEAMRAGKLEFAIAGPAEYVIFAQRVGVQLVAAFERPDYHCVIVTLAESQIDSLEMLKGKNIAFGSIGSTSKHLAPFALLKQSGLDSRKDFRARHLSVELGWRTLLRKQVNAFATTNDKYDLLRIRDRNKVSAPPKVIAKSSMLPGDVFVASNQVSPEIVSTLKQALSEHEDALVAAMLQGDDNQKYLGMKVNTKINDADYDSVREMYGLIGYQQFAK